MLASHSSSGGKSARSPYCQLPQAYLDQEFSAFAGLGRPAELRSVARAHVIAWRKDLEARALSPSSIRRKLSALSSLFDYLCERNAVSGNPIDGVKRPMANGNKGSTLALGDAQARKLLEAPQPHGRDRLPSGGIIEMFRKFG